MLIVRDDHPRAVLTSDTSPGRNISSSRLNAATATTTATATAPQHMTDRSHCKLLYDEDEDLHEYEAFYDFSASYSDAERRDLNAVNTDAADLDEGSDAETVEISRKLGVTDLGELVLLDGRTVGNRKWSRCVGTLASTMVPPQAQAALTTSPWLLLNETLSNTALTFNQ